MRFAGHNCWNKWLGRHNKVVSLVSAFTSVGYEDNTGDFDGHYYQNKMEGFKHMQ